MSDLLFGNRHIAFAAGALAASGADAIVCVGKDALENVCLQYEYEKYIW